MKTKKHILPAISITIGRMTEKIRKTVWFLYRKAIET